MQHDILWPGADGDLLLRGRDLVSSQRQMVATGRLSEVENSKLYLEAHVEAH